MSNRKVPFSEGYHVTGWICCSTLVKEKNGSSESILWPLRPLLHIAGLCHLPGKMFPCCSTDRRIWDQIVTALVLGDKMHLQKAMLAQLF